MLIAAEFFSKGKTQTRVFNPHQLRGIERSAQEAQFGARALAARRGELQRSIETAARQREQDAQSMAALEEELARLVAAGVSDVLTLDVCLSHHEKMDGTGYPNRLPAERLNTVVRMSAVCDVYDAITSNRPYKAGWDPAVSLQKMSQWVGAHLDPQVFQAFVRSLGIYPIGSLVMLNTGRLAVVVEQSPQTLLKPIVKTVFSVKSQQRVVPETIDLSRAGCPHQIVSREDPAKWRLSGLNELWAGQAGV